MWRKFTSGKPWMWFKGKLRIFFFYFFFKDKAEAPRSMFSALSWKQRSRRVKLRGEDERVIQSYTVNWIKDIRNATTQMETAFFLCRTRLSEAKKQKSLLKVLWKNKKILWKYGTKCGIWHYARKLNHLPDKKTTVSTKNNSHWACLRVGATRQTDSDLCPYAHWGMFYIKYTAE